MNTAEFTQVLRRFTDAAVAGDGQAFAKCFTEDGVYHDYIYGDHAGRAAISHMLTGLFQRDAEQYHWQMFDPVCDGDTGYAWSLSRFVSKIPEFAGQTVVIDGMSPFRLRNGLIAAYHESVNGGVAMVQLGVAAPRVEKVLRRWAGTLRARPDVEAYYNQVTKKLGEMSHPPQTPRHY